MQTMLGGDLKRLSRFYTAPRTSLFEFSAANAFIGYSITLELFPAVSDNVSFSEDGVYAEVKILDLRFIDLKNDTDLSCIVGVNVSKIRLLREDGIDTGTLPLVRYGNGFSQKPYHFFETRVSKDLHSAVRKKLAAEILSSRCEKIKALIIKVNGADTAYLRGAAAVDGGERQHPDQL